MSWVNDLNDIVNFLDRYDPDRRFRFKGRVKDRFEKLEERILNNIVDDAVGDLIYDAVKWVGRFKRIIDRVKATGKVYEILLSRELRSFIKDPKRHLRKKIIFYFHDLLRGILNLDEFISKAYPAIKTSLRTNMRTIYQDWILISIVDHILEMGGEIVYPENRVFSLERSGVQKLGWIPPNMIIQIPGCGYISIFIEAPRPIGWGDSTELRNIWKLYTTLRPDILIYGGKVLNILDLSSEPPVKKPDLIIEVKELHDWYKRVREVRGPFAKPLTIEEWRSMWIEGLWDGLAGVLGVKREGKGVEKRGRSLRLKDVDIVRLYNRVYKPRDMVVVSRVETPKDIIEILNEDGIKVYDGVGFKRKMVYKLVDVLCKYAYSNEMTFRISGDLYRRIRKLSKELKTPEDEIIKRIIEIGLNDMEEMVKSR